MNLNPFVYIYKRYPNSKLATMVNNFCAAMQRLLFFMGFGLMFIVLVGEVSNNIEALIAAVVLIALWLVLKLYKDKWSDMISTKQELIDK